MGLVGYRTRGAKVWSFFVAFITLFMGLLVQAPQAFAAATCSTTTSPPTTYGQVTQPITVTTAGTYRVWSRIKAPNTTNNSYYLQISGVNGGCAYDVGDAASIPANTWTWVNYQNGATSSVIDVPLAAGTYTLTYTGKEPSVELDRVLFIDANGCIPNPTGNGDDCVNPVTGPTVTLNTPHNNDSFTVGATVSLTATASASTGLTISKVEFYKDGALIAPGDTSAPYSYSWVTSSADLGTHSIMARAYDSSGLTASTTPISITVNGVPPSTQPPTTQPPTTQPPTTQPPTTQPPRVLIGDCGGAPGGGPDGFVDLTDLSLVITHQNENYPPCDFDHNGTIGSSDMIAVLTHWKPNL